ncbi:MAG: M1 family metallopeptidase [Nannocystis sp.]|uniref:M1 family metallopeptidase n=1 Tax=Nannocystis sp. TaxID=1962667 RepID=UPI002422D47B|nr:M1 family metallopeptidase [Nannocystis sp.]MBK9755613.1 M1 family metallopeptidase [Nannocystis sp.]
MSGPASTPVPEPAQALRPEALRGEVPARARVVDYVIDARLDAEQHRITGTVRITWHNTSTRAVDQLPLHLYMNSFRAEDTAWMSEARGSHRGVQQTKAGAWGYIDVTAARLLGRGPGPELGELETGRGPVVPLTAREGDDPSVGSVRLPAAVQPGEQVVVELEFLTQLPEVFARTGYADQFHIAGQWFPKLGVLQPDGVWRTHVFTLNAEFYADFGDYEVHLDVPEAMVVGATGILVAADPPADGRKRLHYRAEMVHDFAWAADPAFVEASSTWKDVRIRQLLQPEHLADAPLHLEALVATLESMEARFGPYPWSTITVVHPPERAKGAQGMEYPTFFTTSEVVHPPAWVALFGLEERFSGVFTTVHEFGHQYFQGMLASDEAAQPWLDEGLNTTSNMLTLADWHGEQPWFAKIGNQRITVDDFVRGTVDGEVHLDPVDAPAETYRDVIGSYGDVVYRKTGAILMTLRNLAGPARFDAAFKSYALTWRFRHPTGADLVATLLRELGPTLQLAGAGDRGDDGVRLDVADFLDQSLHTVNEVDFSLEVVKNRRRVGAAGWHRDEHGALTLKPAPESNDLPVRELADAEVEAVVVIHRSGEFRLPVELEVEFVDGTRERSTWAGQDRYKIYTWPGRRVRAARIDPDHKLSLESRRLDNHRAATDAARSDGLSRPVGDLAEAASLALLGGLSL